MQNTLLGLAIAVILALVAALFGPLVIDWGGHRSLFETEISRLIGADVRVNGAIEARLLPSPRVVLHGVEVGNAADVKLRVGSLAVDFALAPLMRGEWRASEMTVSGPQFRVALDSSGKLQAPSFSVNLDPDALSIERLSIEGGTATFSDAANGATLVLDKLWFNGELRSLTGPVKGEGAVTVGGELYPYRVSLSRPGADGAVRLHLNIDTTNTALSIETDGTLSLNGGDPRYEGTLNLARPVGIARGADVLVTQSWRAGGKIKASAVSALMEVFEFQYGSEQQGIKLTGTAEFKFGPHPRFDGVLLARQVDLDQVAGGDAARPPPAATLRRLAGIAAGAFRPSIPIQIGIGIDQVTLGGGVIQTVRGDISAGDGAWMLDRFEFRAPGFTQVRLNGRLGVEPNGVSFTGPADIESADPNALAAWLEGRAEPSFGAGRNLHLRGEVTLGSEKIAIERLDAALGRDVITGRFVYEFAAGGIGARLDAALNAPEIDIDSAIAFAGAALAGSSVERPTAVALAVDIDRATVAGFSARKASARLRLEAGRLDISRLSVDDLGGASLSASGQLTLMPVPRGELKLVLDARDLTAFAALLSRPAPALAEALQRAAPGLAPAKLRASVTLDGESPANRATFSLDGTSGTIRVAVLGQATAELSALNAVGIRVQGKLEATDGSVLIKLLDLDRVVTVGKDPGLLMLTASGAPLGDLQVVGRLNAGGLTASVNGMIRPADGPSGTMYANVERADLAPFLGSGGTAGSSLPVALTARLALVAGQVTFGELSAVVAGSKLRGTVTVGLDRPHRVAGELNADTLNLAGLIAAGIGMPSGTAAGGDRRWTWPGEPFDAAPAGRFDGGLTLAAVRADLSPGPELRDLRAGLHFADGGLALHDLSGRWAGGVLAGQMSFQRGAEGLRMHMNVAVKDADAESLLPRTTRAPITGKVNLEVAISGSGRSPATLIGALHGQGKISLSQAHFAALDARAFNTVTRAVDKGMAVDAGKIAALAANALDSGQLSVTRATADIAIDAGRLQLGNATVKGEGADAALTGGIDLTDGTINLRMVLSGPAVAAGAPRPDIFLSLRGPLSAPARGIDVSAFTGWLTTRAIERQSKRLEQIEGAPRPPSDARKSDAHKSAAPAVSPQN